MPSELAPDGPTETLPPPLSCEIWVAGFPSLYGGADTELDHVIDLLRRRGMAVNLVPMFGADERMKDSVLARGCSIYAYRSDIFRNRVVVSFCNGEFLTRLPEIMSSGPPAQVIWFNCMTWLFDAEREAHRNGWITYFGFQSTYQRRILEPQLREIREVRSFDYRPFFNIERVKATYREWDGWYRIGRISRDDKAKFAEDTWRIFDRVLVPSDLGKKIYILGYGENAAERCGPPPPGLDWLTWAPNAIDAEDFYGAISTMIHKTGGSRESYCRTVVEAYAHYVVPIVELDYAFPDLVIHGETGFMTSDSDEMSFYASLLAHDRVLHRRMAEAGRRHLETVLMVEDACWAPWTEVLGDATRRRAHDTEPPATSRGIRECRRATEGLGLADARVMEEVDILQPSVTCIMPTYGRPDYVAESLRMFLEQDYHNKELIIMNDCPDQILCGAFPNVRIVNLPSRYATLGEKRNAIIDLAQGELIAIWDDDDVYLPWRLSYSVREMQKRATPFYVPAEFWAYWGDEKLLDNQAIRGWISHPMFVFRKELWEAAGRYPPQTFAEDAVLAERMLETIGQDWPSYSIARYDRVFVMRGRSKYHHASIAGGESSPDSTPGERVLKPRRIEDAILRELVERLVVYRKALRGRV